MIGINNPLNIRANGRNKWLGQTGKTRGFCDFTDVDYCVRCACHLIMRSYCRQAVRSVSGIISRFAPSTENPTANYIAFVCKRTGFFPTKVIRTNEEVAKLVVAMFYFETGTPQGYLNPFNEDYVLGIINRFKIKFVY